MHVFYNFDDYFYFSRYLVSTWCVCTQSPLWVSGKTVYVVDSERVALTSHPVMSPEVVRCVWNEHRRLRDGNLVPPTTAQSLAAADVEERPTNIWTKGLFLGENFEEETLPIPVERPRRNDVVWNDPCCRQTSVSGPRNTESLDVTIRNPDETFHRQRGTESALMFVGSSSISRHIKEGEILTFIFIIIVVIIRLFLTCRSFSLVVLCMCSHTPLGRSVVDLELEETINF